jgi:AAA+ ATPase superfamily predicted ATPase
MVAFIVLCGSYMGFMEKKVLGAKSPILFTTIGRWRGSDPEDSGIHR